ncbi:MAG TPA: PKD domain-containing protein [Patescibacteria group bacterium]|nr:PKD domain-containing protein [Patescibacteria group bacterium]
MKNRMKAVGISVFFLIALFYAYAAATEVSHEYGPLEWSFQGKPVPETHWSPWLPLAQVGFRCKLGFLISDGTITIKTPVRLTFRYDPDAARSGEDFVFGVKAEPAAAGYNTFQSAFGISFPNKIQLGFVGVSGVPIDLPWFDVPMDFWELVAKIPKVGDSVASAVSNIGVNTSTQGALPLGKTDSYHNQRDLITVEISKYKVEDLAPDILGKIPESARTNAMRLIKLATFCSDSEAMAKLQDYTEKALSVLYDAPTLTLKGDPYFKLEGVRLRVNLRVYIPGGKGSGLYTLYFNNMNQFQTVTFRDITPFIVPGDNLTISVEDIAYEFRLVQGLTASVQISVIPLDLDNVEKTVTYTSAVLDATGDPFKIEVPIRQSDSLVQSLRANPGCTSVSVNWASPCVPLKGTVKAYNGNTLVATVIESTFKTAHNVIVPNLAQGSAYRFTVDCVNQSGEAIPGKEITATTVAGTCPERVERQTCNALTLSAPSAIAGPDYVDFAWTTNQLSSTEVMFSPSPDLSLNYVMAVKKVGDVVTQGWVTREGPRQFETSHGLRLTGLEPNTKYYYNLRSWTFTNNDETGNPQDAVGYTGTVTTLPGSPPPTVKIRVCSPSEGNRSIPDMPIILTKNTDIDFKVSVSSGPSGTSNDVIVDRGTTYTLQTEGNACYQPGSTELAVSNTAQGPLAEAVINVEKVPARAGYALDSQGNGIPGATVCGKNSAGAPISTTTTVSGAWVISSGLNPGIYTFTVSKDTYKTATVGITVNSCGRFIGLPVTLVKRNYALNIAVKDQANKAVKGASVLVQEGGATIAQLTTDMQGKAAKAGTFNDDNEHIFTISVTPAATATENILPAQDFVSIESASTRNVTVTCPADKKGPVPSQIEITQAGQGALQVKFKLDDEKGKSSVEYQDPQGQIKNTPFKEGMSSPGSGVSDHLVLIQGSGLKPGTYRIKVKAKDKWNNVGEGEVKEYQLFGGSLWDFKAAQTQSAVTFSWTKFPYPEKFGKYTIKVGTQPPVEIADINTTSYALTNYSSTSPKQVTFSAVAADNTVLALAATVSLQANAATQAGQAHTQQAQAGESQSTAAQKAVLKLVGKPSVAYANKEISLKPVAQTQKGVKVAASCVLDWGDGKKSEADADVMLTHTYAAAGTYQVNLAATLKAGQTCAPAEAINTTITVLALSPKLTLAKASVKGGFSFTIKAQEGSYPIANWTLSFGDGQTDSGQGTVSKSITHAYPNAGDYKVEYTVTDTGGAAVKKSLSFKIAPKP